MYSIAVVAVNTFRETLRDKLLYNLVLFAIALIGSSVLLGTLTIGEHARIVTDMGLASINLVGIIIAVFVGIGLVAKEIERRTIYTILARPVTRSQFVVGKYFGLVLTSSVNVGVMLLIFLATLYINGLPMNGVIFQAVILILVEVFLMIAIALLFSSFSSTTLSAIFTLGVYIIGHLTTDLKGMAENSQSQAIQTIMTVLYHLCPNLEMLNIKGPAASGTGVGLVYVASAASYGLLYAGVLLTAACLIFQRRDF